MHIDRLLIKQQFDYLEEIHDIETANVYKVFNSAGQQVYTAYEVKSTHCSRQYCGNQREFEISLRDNFNTEVARFYRPYKCNCCCFNLLGCTLQELQVKSADGETIGWVKQQKSCRAAIFHICDENENVILQLTRDACCMCAAGGNAEFDVSTTDDEHIGKVTKQWSNYYQEKYTDNDNFGIEFPIDLDVKYKAVILSSLFFDCEFRSLSEFVLTYILGLYVLRRHE